MKNVYFTKQHEWIRIDGDVGTVGISDYAQDSLGDIVYVELPEIGAAFESGQEVSLVESVKAASEVYAPVSGEIVEVNTALESDPAMVNSAAQDGGWFYKIKLADPSQLEGMMSTDQYNEFLETIV